MSEIAITYAGAMPQVRDVHTFVPCFEATRGEELVLKVSVELTRSAAAIAMKRLIDSTGISIAGAKEALDDALIRYGVGRLEATLRDFLALGAAPEVTAETWKLTADDLPQLMSLVADKSCEYQAKARRDLFCLAAGAEDRTATERIDGRRAAPTSRPLCLACNLPSTDYICSHLLHPSVAAVTTDRGTAARRAFDALCDRGQDEINQLQHCHAGGHKCWQRLLDIERPPLTPVSPLSLPESFDVLDAVWRLAFGKNKRLVSLTTTTSPAALSLDCTNRPEFESRLSALADILDKLKVDTSLLPPDMEAKAIHGSLDAVEKSLLHHLPATQHQAVTGAIKTLRRVRQARNAIAHGITEGGGLVSRLRELDIHDAPPNWANAWDSVRMQTANALNILRHELLQWADAAT